MMSQQQLRLGAGNPIRDGRNREKYQQRNIQFSDHKSLFSQKAQICALIYGLIESRIIAEKGKK